MKQRLEQIRKFLVENGLIAIKTLGPVEVKLKADGTDLVKKVMGRKELMEKSNLVLLVETQRAASVRVAKFSLYPQDKPRSQQLRNEILFYEKVVPALRRGWEKIYSQEEMPVAGVYRTNRSDRTNRTNMLITEKAAGRNLGEAFELQNRKVNLAHLKRLVDFLFLVQELEVGEVQKMGIKLEKSPANYDDYLKMFKARKKDLAKILSQEAIEKLSRELEIKEQFLRRGKEVFGNGEVNCDSIYINREKTRNLTCLAGRQARKNAKRRVAMVGAVKIVDWDVLQKIGNPAGQFSYLATALWTEPKLQQELMDYIVQKGRLIYPGFAEYLRLDILLFRGTGILRRHYWQKRGRQKGFRKLKDWLEGMMG